MYLLNNLKYIPLTLNATQPIPYIFLGTEVIGKFRRENSVCIGRTLFDGDYLNTTQKVYGVGLYTAENDGSALDASNLEDYNVLVELPNKKTGNDTKVRLKLLSNLKLRAGCTDFIQYAFPSVLNLICNSFAFSLVLFFIYLVFLSFITSLYFLTILSSLLYIYI